MMRLFFVVLALALPLTAAETIHVPIVMYSGQQMTHTTAQSLTGVSFGGSAKDSVARADFEQYQNEVRLRAVKNGDAVLSCQTVDGRVSEILDISVVPRAQYDLYRSVSGRFAGVDGVGPSDVAVAGRSVVVFGRAFKSDVLETCRDVERLGEVVCAVRLSPAISAVAPEVLIQTRASLDLSPAETGWRIAIRVADVPIAVAEAKSRRELLGWSVPFVRNLNEMLRRWDRQSSDAVRYPPVVAVKRNGQQVEIGAIWNAGQGSRQNVLASIPAEVLSTAAVSARTSPDLLARWWAALLQDTLRMYLLGERPARSSTASQASPLLRVYEHALELRGQHLDRISAPGSLARAAFALALVNGGDPLRDAPLSVPPDLRE